MADGSGGGSNTFLGFIVGGLLVVVVVFGFIMMTGGHFPGMGGSSAPTAKLDVNVKH